MNFYSSCPPINGQNNKFELSQHRKITFRNVFGKVDSQGFQGTSTSACVHHFWTGYSKFVGICQVSSQFLVFSDRFNHPL